MYIDIPSLLFTYYLIIYIINHKKVVQYDHTFSTNVALNI